MFLLESMERVLSAISQGTIDVKSGMQTDAGHPHVLMWLGGTDVPRFRFKFTSLYPYVFLLESMERVLSAPIGAFIRVQLTSNLAYRQMHATRTS